jgi:hypothetical protein
MQKIISLFKRNYDGDRLVRNEVVEGAEWVVRGEGRATRKWDGTCCMIRGGSLYKRYDAKMGRTPPPNFEPAQSRPDEATGHWPGWLPVGQGPEDRWHREAFMTHIACHAGTTVDGTYELCGPKVQGNPERLALHELIPHGAESLADAPREFNGLKGYLEKAGIEGIVWHHPDGRMVKIKAKDFGIARP